MSAQFKWLISWQVRKSLDEKECCFPLGNSTSLAAQKHFQLLSLQYISRDSLLWLICRVSLFFRRNLPATPTVVVWQSNVMIKSLTSSPQSFPPSKCTLGPTPRQNTLHSWELVEEAESRDRWLPARWWEVNSSAAASCVALLLLASGGFRTHRQSLVRLWKTVA